LAREGGVGVETVRYYQRRGLLPEPKRIGAAIRRYGPEDIQRLRFIRSAQIAGLTLEEIGELLTLDALRDRSTARAIAKKRIAALDARIAEMIAARDALKRLAESCGRRAKGLCPIIEAFTARPAG
jgi:MerR family mercuric resistance operon transcriptional regulator